jgi:general secretion pathway protein A
MYKAFFNLQSNPFAGSPDPRFMYMMPHTREALATLEYGISARKGFIVLTGEVGTGKTTLLRRALATMDQSRVFSSFIFNPRLDVLDFLEFILADFGISAHNRTKSGMLIQLNRWLIERFRREETCVIVVDEAQNLAWELLEEIRLLTNLETASEKLVQIVLSGQPELEEKLRAPDVRQLRQRIALWCRTHAISAEQTAAYIAQRLLIAGTSDRIFSEPGHSAHHQPDLRTCPHPGLRRTTPPGPCPTDLRGRSRPRPRHPTFYGLGHAHSFSSKLHASNREAPREE